MNRAFSWSAVNLVYGAIAASALIFTFFSDFLGAQPSYKLPFLMIFTATTASIYGLKWGFAAGILSAVLLARLAGLQAWDGLLLLLSVLIANGIGGSLRRAHRHARMLARSHQLLAEALEVLPALEHRQALLASLPEHLTKFVSGGHASVWLPQKHTLRLLASVPTLGAQEISAEGVVGRAFREGRPQYVPDVRQEPSFIAAPGINTLAELALPLFERGEVVAVFNLETERPFWPEEVDGLIRFAETVSLHLDRLADLEARRLLSDLSVELHKVTSLEEASEMALSLLLQGLSLRAGVVWEVRGARMQALAHAGVDEPTLLEVLREGLPYGQGRAWDVYASGKPFFTQRYAEEPGGVQALQALGWRTFAAHPIPTPGSPRSRYILVVGTPPERNWRKAEQELLLLFCRTLGIGFERLIEKGRHEGVSRLVQALLQQPSENLYQMVLEEAIQQVPGSEAGSLMVLENGLYRYKAAVGFDLEGLQAAPSTAADMLNWYGLGEERLHQGEPRILSGETTPIYEVSHRTAPPAVVNGAGRVHEIQANLCLPIAFRGEVLAYLNLDNLHDPQAFGEDSLRAAQFFAAPLATLLHDSKTHRLLEEAALTDPLTRLPNRRAFDKALAEELERAVRYGYPLSLIVMDLKGFKAVNDRLGHPTGDLALIRVAELLEKERRSGDYLFRWGGDEFAAIFPHTDKAEAVAVTTRYAQIIESICFNGLRLGVNIGLAAYPEDGGSPEKLLSTADSRMYEAKAMGVPLKS
ncbi:diguanylate cyclase [Meiothermus ruber]|jgi:diguanylate cyclase (GGDEF)-like protein|uniref:Diguanylate cyclase with GAF sensor n=1 Tax=Meiothermus ruber (strain ATCC 35948 / DSM 1279 / VKM B-1258 / 21) TaxID=504728 RepID=D3PKQ7_MEIRD|nr:diguanylate cyclase [Meiothermus ruber]ADD28931.1 diguanylate cyclase with GAF sensor [Meiothermus ruber DSM 1279]AGK05620.1 GAF sensor-containing diguanylate cyclase [Meiothermus ruber DSM 1279]MCL6528737.1 diguanylate cyclase [Meiothermus ruber]GAO75848.1 GAF sensor-containing diguanylate cyclase [Meiothermus ruber H328]